jgi:hypothetical protein
VLGRGYTYLLEENLFLMESSLSSLPMYTMEIYLLPEEVHHKMDSTRTLDRKRNIIWSNGMN